MARIDANDAYDSLPTNDFALAANGFYRCLDSHGGAPIERGWSIDLLGAKDDTSARQVVRCQLNRNFVAGQDADVVHTHLSRNMGEHDVPVFQLDPEGRVRQVFQNLPLHIDDVFFGHAPITSAPTVLGP